jgi:ankyrin repeat protein
MRLSALALLCGAIAFGCGVDRGLVSAAKRGDAERVREYIAAGADVSARDAEGETPLSWAIRMEHPETVLALLGADAPVSSEDLRESIYYGYLEILRILLDTGFDVNQAGQYGQTFLHFAAELGEVEIISELLARGAKIDAQDKNGDTPLAFAAGTNHPSTVAALLELGARADTKDQHGRSPLDTATAEGFDEVVEILRAAGVSR